MNHKLRTALVRSLKKCAVPPFTDVTLNKLLTDTRKLLEELREQDKYPTLKMFCDWVVHPELSGPKVRKLLRAIDALFDVALTHRAPLEIEPIIRDTLSFGAFEGELMLFLGRFGIYIPEFSRRLEWLQFEQTYCEIVGDCWLLYTDKKHPLKHINAARVCMARVGQQLKSEQITPDEAPYPFGMKWDFMKDDVWIFGIFLNFGATPQRREAPHLRNVPRTPTMPFIDRRA